MTLKSQCKCGKVSIEIKGKPILRIICHCTACQAFNQADFADICIFKKHSVSTTIESFIDYQYYTDAQLVKRGKCKDCQQPILETIDKPYSPKMAILPSATIEPASEIPDVSLHTFYHRRTKDIDDQIKKYSGFIPSQTAFLLYYLKARLSK